MTDLLEKFNTVHNPKATFDAECTQMFDKAMMVLNGNYIAGTYDYISHNRKELYQKIVKLEGGLEKFWGKGIEAFREVLTAYYRLTMDCIRLHRESISMSQTDEPKERQPDSVLAVSNHGGQ